MDVIEIDSDESMTISKIGKGFNNIEKLDDKNMHLSKPNITPSAKISSEDLLGLDSEELTEKDDLGLDDDIFNIPKDSSLAPLRELGLLGLDQMDSKNSAVHMGYENDAFNMNPNFYQNNFFNGNINGGSGGVYSNKKINVAKNRMNGKLSAVSQYEQNMHVMTNQFPVSGDNFLRRKVMTVNDKGGYEAKFVNIKVDKNKHPLLYFKVLNDISGTTGKPKYLLKTIGGKQQLVDFKEGIDNVKSFAKPVNRVIGSSSNLENSADGTHNFEFDEDDFTLADTFASYMPSKVRIGSQHPDAVVESSSLSNVESPDPVYTVSLPRKIIEGRQLSALQLESIIYASQQHTQFLKDGCRAGFLIGDGAGVGKGRTIAGLVLENWIQGRKRSLWVSVSNDLKVDAKRDLKDINHSHIAVKPLNKMSYNHKVSSSQNGSLENGVLFTTYASLIAESSTRTKFKSRFQQIVQWVGKDFDGLIIFDECHKAKNFKGENKKGNTKTAVMVIKLQKTLFNARVVYSSATGASEPRQMAYMTRLGIWGVKTPFSTFENFMESVEKRGVGAMELVAMDMKMRGMYVARQLSFNGVLFRVNEIVLSSKFEKDYSSFVILWAYALKMFERAVDIMTKSDPEFKASATWSNFWGTHQRFFKYICISTKVNDCVKLAKECIHKGQSVIIGLQSTGEAQTVDKLNKNDGNLENHVKVAKGALVQLVTKFFPGCYERDSDNDADFCQSFCKNIIDSKRKRTNVVKPPSKRKKIVTSSDESSNKVASDFLDEYSSVDCSVSSSTGSDHSSISDEIMNYKSTIEKKEVFVDEVEIYSVPNLGDYHAKMTATLDEALRFRSTPKKTCDTMQNCLLSCIEELEEAFPYNTLDLLVDQLGGTIKVAEMTGRKGRTVRRANGTICYESRAIDDSSIETCNLDERKKFMDGIKKIAIISEAASSGISLHSDKRVKNTSKRVHITMELAWSADRAIQQFGRSHRSNQEHAPEYVFLISKLAGERRFASSVAKKLESLGALTHGDRRVADMRDLSQFNVDSKHGKKSLDLILKAITTSVPENGIYVATKFSYNLEELSFLDKVAIPEYSGDFYKDSRDALVAVGLAHYLNRHANSMMLAKDCLNINKFLNRILGMGVNLQNAVYEYFSATLMFVTDQAKSNGALDMGIMDIGGDRDKVSIVKVKLFRGVYSGKETKIFLNFLRIERGISWDNVLDIRNKCIEEDKQVQFLVSRHDLSNKKLIILTATTENSQLTTIYRPNTGKAVRQMKLSSVQRNYNKIGLSDANYYWNKLYECSSKECLHMFRHSMCRKVASNNVCENGMRFRSYNVLSGSVLSVWKQIESSMSCMNYDSKIQIVRLITTNHKRIIGCLIPSLVLPALEKRLEVDSTFVKFVDESEIYSAAKREFSETENASKSTNSGAHCTTQFDDRIVQVPSLPFNSNAESAEKISINSESSETCTTITTEESDEQSESERESDVISICSIDSDP